MTTTTKKVLFSLASKIGVGRVRKNATQGEGGVSYAMKEDVIEALQYFGLNNRLA